MSDYRGVRDSRYLSKGEAEAIEFESDAESWRKSSGHSGDEIGRAYENAGDRWKEEKRFLEAQTAYRNAITYGYPQNEARIQDVKKKIDSLLWEKKMNHLATESGLEKKSKTHRKVSPFSDVHAFAVISILSLLGALFFVSLNLTGAVVGNVSHLGNHWLGLGLLLIGVVFAMFYFRRKLNK